MINTDTFTTLNGVSVPWGLANSNCVQDAMHRLGTALRKGYGIEKATRDLRSWLDHSIEQKRAEARRAARAAGPTL